jgi:hypothetical protein
MFAARELGAWASAVVFEVVVRLEFRRLTVVRTRASLADALEPARNVFRPVAPPLVLPPD